MAADRPLPIRAGRIRMDAPNFSHSVVQTLGPTSKPTTPAGPENCVHHLNQINQSSDPYPLSPISPIPYPLQSNRRPKAKDRNLCYATTNMHIQRREPTRHAPNSANSGPDIPFRKKIGATKRD